MKKFDIGEIRASISRFGDLAANYSHESSRWQRNDNLLPHERDLVKMLDRAARYYATLANDCIKIEAKAMKHHEKS